MNKVKKLFIAQKEMPTISLVPKGIIGDKHYDKDVSRSVLLASTHAYDLVKNEGIAISYGMLGENILLDFDLHQLKLGDKLHIGEVVFEISQNCTLCNHLSHIDKRVPKLVKNDRGIFAKVLQGGKINIDDTISYN